MNRLTSNLILASIALALSACSHTSSGPLLNVDKPRADIQHELLQPCESLPLLRNGAEPDVLAHYRAVVLAYRSCSNHKQALVDLLCRELFRCEAPSK
jgi:hypothetical protein